MRKRYLFWSGLALLAILLTLVVWQVSFSFGGYGPADAAQTFTELGLKARALAKPRPPH